MDFSYWKKQTAEIPLYPNIEWSKPEQRAQSGKLAIIGGNKLGFTSVADAYGEAVSIGIGETRVLLPDMLRKMIPTSMTDVIFGATTPSGSLAKEALIEMKAIGEWATGVLLIGDAGRNSETAIVYEDFLREYKGPLIITRDAVDLIKNSSQAIVDRKNTVLIVSFAQLQKLFQLVYYPKVLTFSMQLTNLIEAVHKFTITYPITIVVLHKDVLVAAHDGNVTTTPWDNPMAIWRGSVASKASAYWLWNLAKPLESITASLLK
jgi:NAD(P)H-hydrate repair Nnr-like enzyme with NAD(P)H-hydrate dehydratase domain